MNFRQLIEGDISLNLVINKVIYNFNLCKATFCKYLKFNSVDVMMAES